jgi:hypothetical protein
MAKQREEKLLFGPYRPPSVKPGDRVLCLFRDRDVIITGFTSARLSWPICRPAEPPWGGLGIFVDEELVRAICSESVLALRYWWGVGRSTPQRWRGAFGIGRMDSEGSRVLILGAIQATAEARKEEGDPAHRGVWTPEEEALLGVISDRQVAKATGRTLYSVAAKRRYLGRSDPEPEGESGDRWTVEEDGLVARLLPVEAAAATGRPLHCIYARRAILRKWLMRIGGQDSPGQHRPRI